MRQPRQNQLLARARARKQPYQRQLECCAIADSLTLNQQRVRRHQSSFPNVIHSPASRRRRGQSTLDSVRIGDDWTLLQRQLVRNILAEYPEEKNSLPNDNQQNRPIKEKFWSSLSSVQPIPAQYQPLTII